MKMCYRTLCSILILSLLSGGLVGTLTAQLQAPQSKASSAATEMTRNTCRSLRMADALAVRLDTSKPLAAMLIADIGKLAAQSGDLDAVKRVLQFLEKNQDNPLTMIAKAQVSAALAVALTSQDRVEAAEQIVREIPVIQSNERCTAYSEMARLRAAKADLAAASRFWKLAEESIVREKDAQLRSDAAKVLIRSLVQAGRIDDAKKRAAALEARHGDQSGWEPVAEHFALESDTDTAETIIKSKLKGANGELYQLIAAVARRGRFVEGRAALQEMDDPALAATACHLLAVALARRGSKDLAAMQLKESWSFMDQAKLNNEQSGRILLSSIDPTAILIGVPETLVVCQEFEKRYSPNLAADAYRRLATHCSATARQDQTRYLEIAEQLARKVVDPVDQTTRIQEIFRTRSMLLGEDEALQAAVKISGDLNRAYALLGVAQGRLSPDKK
ncbi:MAG: hypothetical protein JWN70_1637 [Planctomycetaceae bacterium]|nr:hypothetical protein [Planctomycetaceae bacterium]